MPVVGVVPTDQEERIVGHLGPDLCGPDQPDLDGVLDRLTEAAQEPLAGALLDQRIAAGFGNVYAVELPFVVGVAPQAVDLGRARKLLALHPARREPTWPHATA